MNKASGLGAINVLKQVNSIDTDRIRVCHFYKHKTPYYPHSDFHHVEKDNIVIPLKVINYDKLTFLCHDGTYLESTLNRTHLVPSVVLCRFRGHQ